MTVDIIIGSAMIMTGLISELMGLFFYMMNSSSSAPIIAAVIFFITGLILIVKGFGRFRSGMLLKPELIKSAILKTAKKNNGEITKEKIIEEIGWSKIIESEINEMIKEKNIIIDERDGIVYYIFPEFKPVEEQTE